MLICYQRLFTNFTSFFDVNFYIFIPLLAAYLKQWWGFKINHYDLGFIRKNEAIGDVNGNGESIRIKDIVAIDLEVIRYKFKSQILLIAHQNLKFNDFERGQIVKKDFKLQVKSKNLNMVLSQLTAYFGHLDIPIKVVETNFGQEYLKYPSMYKPVLCLFYFIVAMFVFLVIYTYFFEAFNILIDSTRPITYWYCFVTVCLVLLVLAVTFAKGVKNIAQAFLIGIGLLICFDRFGSVFIDSLTLKPTPTTWVQQNN